MPFRRWLPQVLLALAVAAVLIPFPVVARDSPCVPLATVLGKIGEGTRLLTMRVLAGQKLAFAVEVFNSIPPESTIPWDAAYLAIRMDGYGLLIVGYSDQVCGHLTFNPDGMRMFLKDIDGEAA